MHRGKLPASGGDTNSSGPAHIRTFRERFQDREEVYLAHPGHSFRAECKSPADAWEIHEDPSAKPELVYRRIVREISLMEPVRGGTVPLFSLADFATTLVNPLTLMVTRLEPFTENGRRFFHLDLEDCPPGFPMYRKIRLQISADDYAVVHDESVNDNGKTWRGDAVYESRDGVPILLSTRSEGQGDDGSHATNVLTVLDRKFEPIPEEEFTEERLLGEEPVKRVGPKSRQRSSLGAIEAGTRCLSPSAHSPSRRAPASCRGRRDGETPADEIPQYVLPDVE